MAEQFLNRLNKIEESINQLGETLKRMITILGTVTEIKSEIRVAKDEILKNIENIPAAAEQPDYTDELAKMVVQEVGAVRVFVQQSMETLKNDLTGMLQEMISSTQVVQEVPKSTPVKTSAKAAPSRQAPVPEYEEYDTHVPSSIPADKSLKIAHELTAILTSLKMGCISGDVLDAMTSAKESILSTVPSDPIMVKIDKWAGLVGTYPRRNELQARDLVKLKKELKEEIQRYSLT